jgi:hypothetical protein
MGVTTTGEAEKMKAMVDRCLSEYDLDGWKAPEYVNPTDVSVIAVRADALNGWRSRPARSPGSH